MEATYRKFEEWGQFDRYCKLVLYHEAIDYLRELQRLRDNEVSLEVLSPAQWDKRLRRPRRQSKASSRKSSPMGVAMAPALSGSLWAR